MAKTDTKNAAIQKTFLTYESKPSHVYQIVAQNRPSNRGRGGGLAFIIKDIEHQTLKPPRAKFKTCLARIKTCLARSLQKKLMSPTSFYSTN